VGRGIRVHIDTVFSFPAIKRAFPLFLLEIKIAGPYPCVISPISFSVQGYAGSIDE
jgi:hypothetical protein